MTKQAMNDYTCNMCHEIAQRVTPDIPIGWKESADGNIHLCERCLVNLNAMFKDITISVRGKLDNETKESIRLMLINEFSAYVGHCLDIEEMETVAQPGPYSGT